MYSPTYISVEDPRRLSSMTSTTTNNNHLKNDHLSTALNDKDIFRLSINSQHSSTTTTTTATSNSSSQRLSTTSSSEEDHVAYSPPPNNNSINQRCSSVINGYNTSLSPSSRYLLSGSSTSENFRNKILNKFISSTNTSTSSSSRHQKSLSEPSFLSSRNTHMPAIISSLEVADTNNTVIDPWCVSVKFAIENSISLDWLQKYEQPTTFSFGKCWKRRLFILVDRIVFTFKNSKLTNPAKEHFQLTEDTFVFVTEEFKKGYIIELRKPLSKWYIRCDSVTQMKSWLESMKKIVACIKIGYDGLLSTKILYSIKLTDDYRILIPMEASDNNNNSSNNNKKLYRQSLPPAIQRQQPTTSVTVTRNRSLASSSTTSSNTTTRPPSRSSLYNNRQSLSDIPDWETIIPPQLPPPRSKPPPVPPILPTVSED